METDEKNGKKDLTSLSSLSILTPPPDGATETLTETLAEPPGQDALAPLDPLSFEPTLPVPETPLESSPEIPEQVAPADTLHTLHTLPAEPTQAEPIQLAELTDSPPDSSDDSLANSLPSYVPRFSPGAEVKPPVAFSTPAYPFDLRVMGMLTPEEQEKLKDVITREKMGIREHELELQLQGGRVLIPRISEYAGILIIQALRGANALFRLSPSRDDDSTEDGPWDPDFETKTSIEPVLPADQLPLVTEDRIPGWATQQIIDTLIASTTIKSTSVHVSTSTEFQKHWIV